MDLGFAVLDIETIPAQNLPEGTRPEFDESEVKLGNLKDPHKIEEKIQQARENFEAGINKTLATDPDFCQVVCAVGFESETGGCFTWYARDEHEEYVLLYDLWKWIRNNQQAGIPLVGFNTMGFDIPVLVRRAMFSDISIPAGTLSALTRRQDQNRTHYDVMQLLALRSPFSGKLEAKSLAYYLKRFGLAGKMDGVSGGDVYAMFQEGEHEKILEYCKIDVLRTAELFKRIAPWFIHQTREIYLDLSAI